jgi:transposase
MFFCAILYALKSDCQWRMLTSDFPKWETVYFYFKQWNESKGDTEIRLLEQALKKSGYEI